MAEEEFLLELVPEHVALTMEVRDRFMSELARGGSGLAEFLVDDLQKWKPGQTIKAAFLGGSDDLRRDVAAVTREITDACDIKLDFGDGAVRRWFETDIQHAADIRVSFDKKGYSLGRNGQHQHDDRRSGRAGRWSPVPMQPRPRVDRPP